LFKIRAPMAALALTLALLALLAVLSGLFLWQGYRDTSARTHDKAASAAQVVAAHVQWLTEAARQALRRIDETLGDRPDLFLTSTVGDLDAAVASLPGQVEAWVFDADGDPLLTSSDQPGGNIADRPYFQALKGGEEWYISPLFTGARSGRKVFTISRRLERNGKFLGAAVIVVPAILMVDFWAGLDLGPDSSVAMFREDGWLVARFPVPDETMDLSAHPLFTDYLPAARAGTYASGRSPTDGISRVVGYHQVEGAPLIAVAGVSASAAFADFRSRVLAVALFAIPVVLALVAVSVWVATLLRRDELRRQDLARALEQNQLLFREIHHRVKNNLQTVASLVQLQAGNAAEKQEMSRRIAAMAAVHEHIYGSDQFASVDAGDYVCTLVERVRESYEADAEVKCTVVPMQVDAEHALSLGLIVNELVSNALKHAFPDGRKGRIDVVLENTADGRGLLRISDNGVGFDPSVRGKGMGMRLIQGFSDRMGAEYEFQADNGSSFVLRFPLHRPAEQTETMSGEALAREPARAEAMAH
jgi:two-component sensor histidine kinase